MASPEIAIEFLFLQYQSDIGKLARNERHWDSNVAKMQLEFEFKLYFEGFKYVGGGISRKVFVHEKSKRCFKIQYAHNLNDGNSPNELEMKAYLSISKEDRKWFAKPYGFIHGETDLLEVEFVDWPTGHKAKLNQSTFEKSNDTVKRLAKKYKMHDLHGGNYAVNEKTGEVKVLDYAW